MFDFIFKKKKKQALWYKEKTQYMEKMMGKEYGIVGHSMFPFDIGGYFHAYYYPEFHNGTAIATKELCKYNFKNPKNSLFDGYELVMATSNKIDLSDSNDGPAKLGTFQHDQEQISDILNILGRYASTATLNPYDTLEFPHDDEDFGGKCLVFDIVNETPLCIGKKKFGLLLAIEIHRDEMEYAKNNGSRKLLEKFKEYKIYPFTGINRESIANKISQ